jgi:hypothetical protein
VNATVLRRGNIRIDGQRLPIAAVTATNDLIGLRDDAKYLSWMESQWPKLVTRRQLRRWLSDSLPALLTRAAEQLRERGTLPYGELAPFLEFVERTGSNRIAVPSLPSLAAWALSGSAESAAIVSTCGECGLPWISRLAVDYCYRPAPGKTMTCAQLHAHARFAEQRAEWNREYRRIYARKLRGTIADADWRRWVTAAQIFREATRWGEAGPRTLTWESWQRYADPAAVEELLGHLQRDLEPEYGLEESCRLVAEIREDIAREAERQPYHDAVLTALTNHLRTPPPPKK